jgi:hypothetical protein
MTVTTALSCHFEEQVLRMKNKKMNKKEKQECDPDFSIFNHVIACPISINRCKTMMTFLINNYKGLGKFLLL